MSPKATRELMDLHARLTTDDSSPFASGFNSSLIAAAGRRWLQDLKRYETITRQLADDYNAKMREKYGETRRSDVVRADFVRAATRHFGAPE